MRSTVSKLVSVPTQLDLELPAAPAPAAEPIARKVQHVRAARQTRDHDCHWPGCTEQVPPARWGCRKHWYMLPATIRGAIWDAYQRGQEETLEVSEAYVKAARAAQTWIRKNHRG